MKKNKLTAVLVAVIVLMFSVMVLFCVLLGVRVKRKIIIESGQEINIEDFRRFSWDKGAFVWVEQPEIPVAGEYKGKIEVFPIIYQVTLVVKTQEDTNVSQAPTNSPVPTSTPIPTIPIDLDTIAPQVTTKDSSVYAEDYSSVTPEQFIVEIKEDSSYTVEQIPLPALEVYGVMPYRFTVVDAAGNSTEAEAQLYVINLNKTLVSELGEGVPAAEEFLYAPGSEVSFVTDISTINTMSEGSFDITLCVDGIEAVSTLCIKDTLAPTLVLKQAETWLNKPINPNLFIDFEQSFDNSDAFDTAYATEPDWSREGEQTVTISATDAAGNSAVNNTTVVIKKDSKAPVVSVTDIDVKVGGTVSYKKAVSYYDDIDTKEEMTLTIERTGVNLKEVGTYKVIYTVTDCSGNSTSVTGKINVMEEAPKWEDEDAIHKKGEEILTSILEEGMTDREKAKEIYRWIKNNIEYVNHSEKGNYIRGAYEGLFKMQGDCFVYAATAKELLTLAEIPNIDIVKSTTNPSHYWNLVYIEDGWYHFDSTPRKDKSEFFLLTDAELEAYSSSHRNTHIFDRSLYPEIQ